MDRGLGEVARVRSRGCCGRVLLACSVPIRLVVAVLVVLMVKVVKVLVVKIHLETPF